MKTISDHSIKVNRAVRLSGVGKYPRSARAMLDAIPPSIIACAPSRAIADLLDANWRLAQKSKSLGINEAAE